MNQESTTAELSDLVDILYKHGRQIRFMENKARYYGSDVLLYPNEVYTLKAIAQREGINQTELSEETFRTKGATSNVIQKLLQKGLVEQREGADDRRISQLYPTPNGRKVYEKLLEYDLKYAEVLCNRLNLSLDELEKVNRVLYLLTNDFSKRIRENTNVMGEPQGSPPV